MTTVYLIRHAEAEGNLYRRAQGQYDSLITENGYRQIRALSERFKNVPIDTVWSSDLFRTMTTARAILEHNDKNLNTHQGLREINMGVWEDKTWGQLSYDDPEGMAQFSNNSQHWRAERGESFQQLMERLGKTITDLVRQHEGKTMAIFCHGLAIRQFMAYVNQLPPEEWGSSPHGDNTSVTKLLWDGEKFIVEFSADNSHLSDDISTFARQKWWREQTEGFKPDRNVRFRLLDSYEEEKEYQAAMLEVWGALAPSGLTGKTVYLTYHNDEMVGWVSVRDDGELTLLHLKSEFCHDRMGLQLLGQAVSHVRQKGLPVLFFHCPPDCKVGFFEKFGFQEKNGRHELYIGYEPRSDIFNYKSEKL